MPTAFDALTGGQSLFVDLLAVEPASNEVSSWQLPSWGGYYTAAVVPQALNLQGPQAQFRLSYPEPLTAEQLSQIWGVGVYLSTVGLLMYPIPKDQGAGLLVIDYQVARVLP